MKQKRSLTEQLLYLSIIIISIVVVSLGIILPKTLLPIYEENLYNYLKQPLSYIEDLDTAKNKLNSEIAFIYVKKNSDTVTISDNIESIINLDYIEDVLNNIDTNYGKFKIKNKTYYLSLCALSLIIFTPCVINLLSYSVKTLLSSFKLVKSRLISSNIYP